MATTPKPYALVPRRFNSRTGKPLKGPAFDMTVHSIKGGAFGLDDRNTKKNTMVFNNLDELIDMLRKEFVKP